MRKVAFFAILFWGMVCMISSFGTSRPQTGATLYFIDAQVMRLIPVRISVPKTTTELEAKTVLYELIKGRDKNPSIRRIIPDMKKAITVKLKGETAVVNIDGSVKDSHPEGRESETLSIYSIVNSLTSVEKITHVRFTVDGKTQKDFMGYLDMRETFEPDYML